MSWYPSILSESETLSRIENGRSIARFGDGELRLALGGNCISQTRDDGLQAELCNILKRPGECLVGLPNALADGPKKKKTWSTYLKPEFTALYSRDAVYGSAFITRPDSAPWIDTPEYWARIRNLWAGKDVVLVKGTDRSLRLDMMDDAANVDVVTTAPVNAYAQADTLFDVLKGEKRRVIMCCGATATVLAWRLAQFGVQALDLGHCGMTMRKAGQYYETWQAGRDMGHETQEPR